MKLKIVLLNLIILNQALASEEFSVKNYSSEFSKPQAKLVVAKESNKNIDKIIVSNESNISSSPIYPIQVQFLGRNDYEIIKDSCSYKILNKKEKCEVLIKNNDNLTFNLKIELYGKDKEISSIILGKRPHPVKEKIKHSSIKNLEPFPLVEKIGVGDFHEWEIDWPKKPSSLKALNDIESIYSEIFWENGKLKLKIYPKKEDLYQIEVKTVIDDTMVVIPLKFTAIVRKPFKLKIVPNIESLAVSEKPIKFYIEAEYISGVPKKSKLHSSLIEWKNNIINGEFTPKTEGQFEISATFLNQNTSLLFNVRDYWPYGKNGDLIVKSNEVKEIKTYINDFNNLIIKKGGTLKININNPWVFIGIKNSFINEGTIEFFQNYSGDLSTNFPNYEGILSGERITIETPSNSLINGGFIYIKANNIKNIGNFKINPINANSGKIYIFKNENINISSKNKNVIISNYENPIIYKNENQDFNTVEPIKPTKAILKTIDSSEWSLNISIYSFIRYLIGAFLMYVFLYFIIYKKILKYKIQDSKPNNDQIKRELLFSFIGTLFVSFLVSIVSLSLFKVFNIFKFYSDPNEYGLLYLVVSYPLIIIMHDIYFYFTHRLMHTKLLYNKIHSFHHKSKNPTPLTSFSFSIWESIIQLAFLSIASVIFPFHIGVVALFLWTTQIQNAYIHCGFSFRPQLLKNKWFYIFLGNPAHHNDHHNYSDGNFGLYFNLLDFLFKTNSKKYIEKGPDEFNK
jgi:lathosterol oxidase